MSAISSAGDAFEAYAKGEYDTCGDHLKGIHNLKTAADVKVTHNILINDYFKAGCADPCSLLSLLTQAYDRAREKEKKDKGKRKKEDDEEDHAWLKLHPHCQEVSNCGAHLPSRKLGFSVSPATSHVSSTTCVPQCA